MKHITAQQFKNLTRHEQLEILIAKKAFAREKTEKGYYDLYDMKTFDVSVDYSGMHEIIIQVWDKELNAQNITLQEFRVLDWEDMQSYVYSDAVKLSEIQYDEEHISRLFQLPNFYVEIKYYDGDYVEAINSFDDTDLLEPYLEKIIISLP